MPGNFICFDGLDGSGKSTQIELLMRKFESLQLDSICVRDPGGTQLGEALREILLHRQQIPLSMTAEMLIYMASRAQLVQEVIRPALDSDRIVIGDRFLLANVVYQGYAGGLEIETIRQVGQIATTGLQPDVTFLCDLPAESAIARLSGAKDRLESRGLAFMEKVRGGFLTEAQRSKQLIVLDATQSAESIHQQVLEHLTERKLIAASP